jgi:hypothetical protein
MSAKDQIYTVFAHGLCWDVMMAHHKNAPSIRRKGFPSWSWAGWLANVKRPDVSMSNPDTPTLRISVARTDGVYEVLTEALAARTFENVDDVASLYTFNLFI